ncbi:hypothetical protein AGLY_001396 [Aphis glycines]|uniref:Uncharacterized protein n=1 Tax=Aphis glycines TaxID=307491 RepID=A0A6G0U5I8_APHGL|nr:hypothetical protein AGLY_001396 [Aphis glycines]
MTQKVTKYLIYAIIRMSDVCNKVSLKYILGIPLRCSLMFEPIYSIFSCNSLQIFIFTSMSVIEYFNLYTCFCCFFFFKKKTYYNLILNKTRTFIIQLFLTVHALTMAFLDHHGHYPRLNTLSPFGVSMFTSNGKYILISTPSCRSRLLKSLLFSCHNAPQTCSLGSGTTFSHSDPYGGWILNMNPFCKQIASICKVREFIHTISCDDGKI